MLKLFAGVAHPLAKNQPKTACSEYQLAVAAQQKNNLSFLKVQYQHFSLQRFGRGPSTFFLGPKTFVLGPQTLVLVSETFVISPGTVFLAWKRLFLVKAFLLGQKHFFLIRKRLFLIKNVCSPLINLGWRR